MVTYAHDPLTGQGYVYLPGKNDPMYTLNTRSMYRYGREGQWFYATAKWQDAAERMLTR